MNTKRIFIYECAYGKYYVGTSKHDGMSVINRQANLLHTLAPWLQLYPPVKIIGEREYNKPKDVDDVVIELMNKHGVESTRGTTAAFELKAVCPIGDYYDLPIIELTQEQIIEQEVERRLKALIVQQEVIVKPTEQLYTATSLARMADTLTPNKLNVLVQLQGLHEPYKVRGVQYWRTTDSGKASGLIDDVPVGSGVVTTTRHTVGILELLGVLG